MMKISSIFLLLFPVSLAIIHSGDLTSWEGWKRLHGKVYNQLHEDNLRKEIWLANAERVRMHNRRYAQGLETYYTRLNQFADLTWTEFKQKYLGSLNFDRTPNLENVPFKSNTTDIPDWIDWRDEKIVTPVKNGGTCSASWAFATTAAVESQYAIANGQMVNMSVQQLIDCSKPFGNIGCHEGWMENAYRYLNLKAIEEESAYPYTAKENDECKENNTKGLTKVKMYYSVHSGDDSLLQELVAVYGPAAAAIDADEGFMLYGGGIYQSYTCNGNNPNLALLLVGYGSDFYREFWLAKTNLGTEFGEDGYVKLMRFRDMCGIASYASVPILKKFD